MGRDARAANGFFRGLLGPVVEAAAVRESSPPAPDAGGPFTAVICAVGTERRWLAGAARPGVEVLASGIGAAAARRRGEQAVARGATAIVAAGFCGAIDPCLRVGDLVVAERVVEETTGDEFPASPDLLARAPGRRGTLVTAARLVRTPADRNRLSGLACDMESAALARVASAARIPFVALRAVTDEARHTLPDFDRIADRAGQLTPGWGLLHFLLHPADAPRLVRLWPASRRAGEALRRGVGALLEEAS